MAAQGSRRSHSPRSSPVNTLLCRIWCWEKKDLHASGSGNSDLNTGGSTISWILESSQHKSWILETLRAERAVDFWHVSPWPQCNSWHAKVCIMLQMTLSENTWISLHMDAYAAYAFSQFLCWVHHYKVRVQQKTVETGMLGCWVKAMMPFDW